MKTFLITGITSGIGYTLFKDLIKTNIVYGIYRDEIKFNNLLNANKTYSDNIIGIKLDLNNPETIENKISKLTNKFDGFIYCAGVADTRPIKLSDFEFNKLLFNVNYFSFLELIRTLFIKKLFNENSSIIAFSSVTSQSAQKGKVAYAGSKGALESSIKSIALEFIQSRIRINSIRSAMVDTEILNNYKETMGNQFLDDLKLKQPLGIISKDDVLFLINYLLSDSSLKLTGSTINLDAGWLL
jgi:NAD(P)-dependent dehydrogenase (short-subunit alcohol dehydrogenase family)